MIRSPTIAELHAAYAGRRVLVTGHTGFKGSWLTLWLRHLEAKVTGFALPPDTTPSLFDDLNLASQCTHVVGDVRDAAALTNVVKQCDPDFVFHLAAQPLVRRSYAMPIETLQTNVMGVAHLLDVLRLRNRPCSVVVVTSDKCYDNRETVYGFRENEPLGGCDVYSASKGAAELVVHSFRSSFFHPDRYPEHGVAIATARAGNVVGGGDWATERLVPDCIRSLVRGDRIPIRNPGAVRPWQHVIEALGGYLLLGARLGGVGTTEPAHYAEPWNFGPGAENCLPVGQVVASVIETWGTGAWIDCHDTNAPHEAGVLRLSIDKSIARLGWLPRWGLQETIVRSVAWYRARHEKATTSDLVDLCLRNIHDYMTGT